MLKKLYIKKIILSSFVLLVLALMYILPNNVKDLKVESTTNYVTIKQNLSEIYLLDKNNLIARTTIASNTSKLIEDLAKDLLESLIIDGKEENNLPNGFKPLIPIDTKILSLKLENKTLKVNFSKEILSVKAEYEEKMLESIIFTLTSINGVDNIIIYVEDKIMTELPNSKKFLPNILDKNYGINKKYSINTINNIVGINVYYISKNNEDYYYVPVTKYINNNEDKIKVIIEEMASTYSYETNLISFLSENAKVLDYEIKDKQMIIEFNNSIIEDLSKMNILEEVKYTMFLTMRDNFNINELVFNVDNQQIDKTVLKDID